MGIKKSRPGRETATGVRRKGGVPDWRWTDESEIEPGVAAVWSPNDPRHENGVVLLNRQFADLVELKEFWKQAYADHLADEVHKCIEEVYGEVMVAKVAAQRSSDLTRAGELAEWSLNYVHRRL
jgi:hypothetical protein